MGPNALPRLKLRDILTWVDDYRRKHGGRWPSANAGRLASATRENWRAVDYALRTHGCDQPGVRSLAKVMEVFLGKRNP